MCYPKNMDNILEILKRNDFVMKKKFGQNFITDANLLGAIASDAGIEKGDVVVEIGAGAGTLTKALCQRAKKVIAFEIDASLKGVLESTLKGVDNVELIFSDILKADREELRKRVGGDFKVVANLPYYITSPVLFYFLESDLPLRSVTVMVQKEVAERMVAKCDTPEYGVLSLSVQSRGKATVTRIVGKEMFYPRPSVDSAVVRIDIGGGVFSEKLFKLFRCAFAMRRKTLANNLMSTYGLSRERAEAILTKAGLDLKVRGEALDLGQFVSLLEIMENS